MSIVWHWRHKTVLCTLNPSGHWVGANAVHKISGGNATDLCLISSILYVLCWSKTWLNANVPPRRWEVLTPILHIVQVSEPGEGKANFATRSSWRGFYPILRKECLYQMFSYRSSPLWELRRLKCHYTSGSFFLIQVSICELVLFNSIIIIWWHLQWWTLKKVTFNARLIKPYGKQIYPVYP